MSRFATTFSPGCSVSTAGRGVSQVGTSVWIHAPQLPSLPSQRPQLARCWLQDECQLLTAGRSSSPGFVPPTERSVVPGDAYGVVLRDLVCTNREAEAPKTASAIRTFVSFRLPAPARLREEEGTVMSGLFWHFCHSLCFLNCLENLPAAQRGLETSSGFFKRFLIIPL